MTAKNSLENLSEEVLRFNALGREQWNQKAHFWDNLHGDEGNLFHRELVSPAVERLLGLKQDEEVLDIACGSGVLARRMATLGAKVTATDFSKNLLELAQARQQPQGHPIHYLQVDAVDEQALTDLGGGKWDAVTCTMAFMDMPTIAPLMQAVRKLLKPNGRFVFVTAHPAFSSNNPIFGAEMKDKEGELVTEYYLKIGAYISLPPTLQVGARGEPSAHYYYHRSLQDLLGVAFQAGLVLDSIEEPAFSPETDSERLLSWKKMPQIPPILVGRLRL